ncbi:hypothetical protein HD554DRAFT_2168903 [Boletus coccyginus]|nr:hypothetical protein HD554DRAFT_2168903 [Boletus coccyginus]
MFVPIILFHILLHILFPAVASPTLNPPLALLPSGGADTGTVRVPVDLAGTVPLTVATTGYVVVVIVEDGGPGAYSLPLTPTPVVRANTLRRARLQGTSWPLSIRTRFTGGRRSSATPGPRCGLGAFASATTHAAARLRSKVNDRPKQALSDTGLSIALSGNAWVLLPSYPVARAVARVGTQPVGRGRPNALLSVAGAGAVPVHPDPGPAVVPHHARAYFSLTVESNMSVSRVVATTLVVPFLPCHRRRPALFPPPLLMRIVFDNP